MLEQSDFLETLRSVAELRRTSAEPLPKEELLKYFDGMELSGEQKEMIYQYLLLPPEVQTAEPEKEEEPEASEIVPEGDEEDRYFQMYLDDLENLEELTEDELMESYRRLLAGDASVIREISENWLKDIANMALNYAARGVNVEDVIQEGNMGLLMKLSELAEAGENSVAEIEAELERAVTEAMESFTAENEEAQVSDLLVKEKESGR